jgi:hypothetical protein
MVSRRHFLTLGFAGAILAPRLAYGRIETEDQVPSMLDHILLGCHDLKRGIDFVERHTGVGAAFGGVHPGRGTQNALLSLGTRRYLEVIAPDPQQTTDNPLAKHLKNLNEPHLVGWAAHSGDMQALAGDLAKAGIAADGPTPGSRKRPDGRVLHWKTLNLRDDGKGLLPFFIEWSADTVHPSEDAPKGCQLSSFELHIPDPAALAKTTAKIGLTVRILAGPTAQLRAVISGPKGKLDLTS